MRGTLVTPLVFGFIVALPACQGESQSPLNVDSDALELSANPVIQSVTGSGSFVAPQGDWRTFAFTARSYADGSVAGQWERIRRQPGNASGTTTIGLLSTPPNNENAWRVVDNGQGANSPPDQMSLEFVGAPPGFAANYCATTPAAPSLNAIQAGNIQVKL
jgi:hypothetical protein